MAAALVTRRPVCPSPAVTVRAQLVVIAYESGLVVAGQAIS